MSRSDRFVAAQEPPQRNRWPSRALLLALLTVLTGCPPSSKNPLSDDATTAVDQRLVGWWEAIPKEGELAEADERFLIGRHGEDDRRMELGMLRLDEEGRLRVDRVEMRATTLDGSAYLSLADGTQPGFMLVRYVVQDEDRIELHLLSEKVVVEAIESGALAGTIEVVERASPEDPGITVSKDRIITITASTPDLRSWVQANAEACFDPDTPVRYRRVH